MTTAKPVKTQVLFDDPICIELHPPESDKPLGHPENRPHHFTHGEINALISKYMEDGWDERAVVVKTDTHKFQQASPYNWGIVIDLNRTMGVFGQAYAPIKVRWLGSGSMSSHWPEELYLIHESVSLWDFQQIIEQQQDI